MDFELPRLRFAAGTFAAGLLMATAAAQATPLLVMDASNGAVIYEQDATKPWYPASLTKLVTVYAALKAVQEHRITLDTPLVVSARAARMPPSKMGFKPGTEVTLDNALKMLMVKSANDLAIVIAEGISGSVENFANEMNRVAANLGMRQSHFVNPNGLHDANHYSSARDMALVGQALYRDFPDHEDLYGIGALRLGTQIIPTHNGLMGRYPGAEGMKTGFTCPAGFNVVVSATRGGRRLIAVVLGYPSAKSRTLKAASLLDIGFAGRSSGPQIASLPDAGGSPPNMRSQICTAARQEPTEDDYAVPVAANSQGGASYSDPDSPAAFFANDGRSSSGATLSSGVAAIQSTMATRPYFEPIPVFLGRAPGYTGPVAGPRDGGAKAVGSAVTAAIAARSAETARAEREAKAQAKAAARAEAREKAKAKAAAVKVKATPKAKPVKPKAEAKAKPEKAKPVRTAGEKPAR